MPIAFCTIKETTATTNQQDRPRAIGLNPFAINFLRFVLRPIAAIATMIPNLPDKFKKLVIETGSKPMEFRTAVSKKPITNQGKIVRRL